MTLAVLVTVLCCVAPKPVFAQKNKKNNADKKSATTTDPKINALLFEAVGREMKNDIEGAIVAYKMVLQNDSQNDAAMFALGKIYLENDNIDQALVYAELATKTDPKNKWYLAQYAEALDGAGKYPQAADTYKKLLAQYPYDYENAFNLGYILLKMGDMAGSIAAFDQVEKGIGVSENLSVQKQKLYMKLGKTDKAIAELQKLIDSDPQEPHYYQLLAELYQANNMPDKAMETIQKMLAKSPDDPYGNLMLADFYRQSGDNTRYFESLQKAFASPQLPINPKAQLISSYIDRKDASPQIDDLVHLIVRTHPRESLSYVLLGDYLFAVQGKKQEALQQFRIAAQMDGNRYEVWEQIMNISLNLQDFAALQKDSRQISELFPNEPAPYFYNGLAANQLGKHDEAVKSLKKAAMMSAANKELSVQVYNMMGDSYNALKDYPKSDESYEKALAIAPNSATVLNNYAYFLSLRSDQLDKAAQMSAKSNQLEPNNGSYQDTYAWILYTQKKYTEARAWIEKALGNGGDKSGTVLEHYGDILYQLGETSEAVVQWQKAKAAGGELSAKIDQKIKDRKLY